MAEIEFPKPSNRIITTREAFINIPDLYDIDKCFLLLSGKTSKYIKILYPGQRLEELYELINGKGKKAYFAFSKVHPDKPARTISKDSAGLFHYEHDRTLTIGEYKRVASFPDRYQFIGSFNSALARIGNSVPPLMVYAIATAIGGVRQKK